MEPSLRVFLTKVCGFDIDDPDEPITISPSGFVELVTQLQNEIMTAQPPDGYLLGVRLIVSTE
jgi:hypothetical protein